MPYTIHAAKAAIKDGQQHWRDIDVFASNKDEALEAIGQDDTSGARGAALTAIAQAQQDATSSVQAIVDKLNTNTSNQLTDASAVANMIAQHFDQNNTYENGTYVRYTTTSNDTTINKLYRLTANHAAGVTWENTSKVEVEVGEEVADLKSAMEENLLDKKTIVNPTNWYNPETMTAGECKASGNIEASAVYSYTDFIPVTSTSKVRVIRGDVLIAAYRRNITCYDKDKTVLSGYGNNADATTAFDISTTTDPSKVKYVRVTIDNSIATLKPMIVLDGEIPSAYIAYHAPYDVYTEDFLTQSSEASVQMLNNKTMTTADMANKYGFAIPAYKLRQTVGIAETWYKDSMATPSCVPIAMNAGAEYITRREDGFYFSNASTFSGGNGYKWAVYDMLLNVLAEGMGLGAGFERAFTAENLANCTVLYIGDSTVNAGVITQTMLNYFTSKSKTLTLLGTRGSGDNKREGRPGWSASDYLTDRQYDGVTNPFYNPNTQTFDFAYYMTNQSYSAPDFVVIQLGINDLYSADDSAIAATWTAIQTMVDSILAYNTANSASIKILLNLPTTPNSDPAQHPQINEFLYRNRLIRYNGYALGKVAELYQESKVRVSYCHMVLDSATDIRDNVHPTDAGYAKMAMEVINQINCWQNSV